MRLVLLSTFSLGEFHLFSLLLKEGFKDVQNMLYLLYQKHFRPG